MPPAVVDPLEVIRGYRELTGLDATAAGAQQPQHLQPLPGVVDSGERVGARKPFSRCDTRA